MGTNSLQCFSSKVALIIKIGQYSDPSGIVMEWIPISAFVVFLIGLGIVVRDATKE